MNEQQLLENLKNKRILLVRGNKSFTECGAEAWLTPYLNVETTEQFFGFYKNPDLKDLHQGIRFFRDFKPDLVLAVGGGSVMDMAKAIRFFGSITISPDDWLDGQNDTTHLNPEVPLYAIPTTSGAGAEATHFAVLYRDNKKYSVAHPALKSTEVLLKPELTMSMNAFQAAVSGLDAFFQGVESWWSRNATKESRAYSEEAVKLVLNNLPNSVHHADFSSREAMQNAAFQAGKAIDIAKTTSCHAFSYILTTEFGLPHGQAVAVTFPFILDYNLRQMKPEDAEKLKALLGISGSSARKFGESFIESLNIDYKIPVSSEKLNHLFTNNVNVERLKNNPVEMNQSVFMDIAEYCTTI
ncbi:MAG: hypothetical protein DRJ08_06920 [Acidobacteria bacterium]|nr:MAG: hypothetical protein DRJ08_06920 [Acidobacteriota bacterium]